MHFGFPAIGAPENPSSLAADYGLPLKISVNVIEQCNRRARFISKRVSTHSLLSMPAHDICPRRTIKLKRLHPFRKLNYRKHIGESVEDEPGFKGRLNDLFLIAQVSRSADRIPVPAVDQTISIGICFIRICSGAMLQEIRPAVTIAVTAQHVVFQNSIHVGRGARESLRKYKK